MIENAVDKVSDIVVQGTAGDGWAVEEAASSIDGKVLSAKRTFQPDNQTTFVADVQCIPATGAVSVAIESYLGDVSEPSPGSEFSRTAEQNLMGGVNIVPVGRVKPNGHKVRDLSGMFSISEAASNRIELRRPPIIEIFGESVVNVPDELRQKLNTDDVNYARVVSDMLPLSVEVNNGSGKHEVIIDPAPQVAQVLAQCGGTGDVVKPEGVARIQAAEEAEKKADEEARLQEEQRLAARQAETDAFNKDLCRNRGSHPMYKAMCESKFPDDYAAYQQDIDQIVADAKSKRCKLDRIAVEDNASRNGVASERERIAAMDKCSWLN
ncbi:hypothetical protein [Pseudoxanthomonas mexicana]